MNLCPSIRNYCAFEWDVDGMTHACHLDSNHESDELHICACGLSKPKDVAELCHGTILTSDGEVFSNPISKTRDEIIDGVHYQNFTMSLDGKMAAILIEGDNIGVVYNHEKALLGLFSVDPNDPQAPAVILASTPVELADEGNMRIEKHYDVYYYGYWNGNQVLQWQRPEGHVHG